MAPWRRARICGRSEMTSIRERFGADHAALLRSLDALGNASEGADASELVRVWREFEAGLRAHLEVEEAELFPLLPDRAERTALERDHERFREQLDELGLQVEVHAIRKESVDTLCEALRAHAAREDAVLYRVADERGLTDGPSLLDRPLVR